MANHSNIALGTMQFLWTTTEKEAFKILDEYYSLGGDIIDTADMYTNWVDGLQGGEAETIIGKWLHQKKNREKITLMSKVGAKVWEGSDGKGLSQNHILKAIDKTLLRLQTDYLDIYISHWSDPNVPIEETFSTYEKLIKQGKVRTIGCSNYTGNELEEALRVGVNIRTSYSHIQAYYNLLDRSQFEEQLLPLIKNYNLKVFIYGPLASGFLSGVYRKNKPIPENVRAQFVKEKMTDRNFKVLDTVGKIGEKYHATSSQISLAWLLQKGYIPIIGTDVVVQVRENMLALQITLDNCDIELLNKLIY